MDRNRTDVKFRPCPGDSIEANGGTTLDHGSDKHFSVRLRVESAEVRPSDTTVGLSKPEMDFDNHLLGGGHNGHALARNEQQWSRGQFFSRLKPATRCKRKTGQPEERSRSDFKGTEPLACRQH